ncbi:MAG: ATP-binding protein [Anaerolineaceae bacterium]
MSNKSFQLSSNGSKTDSSNEGKSEIRSIKDLIDQVSGKNLPITDFDQESGFAESVNFPFFAIVGQYEMKLALTLSLINPNIGGVLIIGPRGIGKTTAIRALIDLLPQINVSHCYYGCTEEDVDQFGIDSICPNCAKKVANNIPLSEKENVHLVELPLNANLDDVIGGLDKRQLIHQKMKIKRGILAMADKNILYIDEINLLNNEIVNAILDAASMGKYTIRRGPISATYQSRFTLIGSMNPEEGILRPQIFDRFGLRITTKGLSSETERYEAYQRAMNYKNNPKKYTKYFERETKIAREELEEARNLVQTVQIPEEIAENGIKLIKELNIDSIRAEISLFESAKALAASDRRQVVLQDDIRVVAPMALRLRTSQFMSNFISQQEINDQIIKEKFDLFFKNNIL